MGFPYDTGDLVVAEHQVTGGRVQWRLVESLVYQSNSLGNLTVPKGFVTDFASVPRFFWRLVPPTGKWNRAAVVHDYAYSRSSGFQRHEADKLFFEAMSDLGVATWRKWVMWAAVRSFGQKAYHSK